MKKRIAILLLLILLLILNIGATFALPSNAPTATDDYGYNYSYFTYNYPDGYATEYMGRWYIHTAVAPIPSDAKGYYCFFFMEDSHGNYYPVTFVTCSSVNGSNSYNGNYCYASEIDSDTDISLYTPTVLTEQPTIWIVGVTPSDTSLPVSVVSSSVNNIFFPKGNNYQEGFDAGFAEGSALVNAGDLILDVVSAPANVIAGALNFEVFGVNFAGIVFFLMTAAIIFAIIKILRSIN